MRRKEREVTDQAEIAAILREAEILRLALNNGPYPYLLPVNFAFTLETSRLTLFFHSARQGGKHDVIRRDNRAAFEIDCRCRLLPSHADNPCATGFAYASVIGCGTVEPVPEAEKEQVLLRLLAHYGVDARHLDPAHVAATACYAVHVHAYSAKQHVG